MCFDQCSVLLGVVDALLLRAVGPRAREDAVVMVPVGMQLGLLLVLGLAI
jgi:hypothetical protein